LKKKKSAATSSESASKLEAEVIIYDVEKCTEGFVTRRVHLCIISIDVGSQWLTQARRGPSGEGGSNIPFLGELSKFFAAFICISIFPKRIFLHVVWCHTHSDEVIVCWGNRTRFLASYVIALTTNTGFS